LKKKGGGSYTRFAIGLRLQKKKKETGSPGRPPKRPTFHAKKNLKEEREKKIIRPKNEKSKGRKSGKNIGIVYHKV